MTNKNKILFSFVFIVGLAFLTHFLFVQKIQEKDRAVASFSDRDSASQIQWEQKMAQELAQDSANQVQSATQPDWHDKLAYEFLAGKYQIQYYENQLQKIQVQDPSSAVKFTTEDFLKKFGRRIKNFSSYKIDSDGNASDQIQLLDQNGQSAGQVQIQRDAQGFVQSITIQ